VPDLDGGQQRVGVRAGQPDQGVDRGGGEVGQERAGNVTFTPMPAVIASSMAVRPCGVPGILTSRLGKPACSCSRRASATVAVAS
jgi:hypothetical protein